MDRPDEIAYQAVSERDDSINDAPPFPDVKPPRHIWWAMGFTVMIGLLGVRSTLREFWFTWTDDPLQSLGLLLLLISPALVLLHWRRLNWERRGSWWGLLLVALAYFLDFFRDSLGLTVYLGDGHTVVHLIPLALRLFLFGVGVVIFFAGFKLLRVAWFPLLLLLMAKPVPQFFSTNFDLPLQSATAHVARSFATVIGFAPTTPQLLLMFSPDYGMFIAPGCDGIRGAATMGYLALIVGYLKRLRTQLWIGFVVTAVLLGYLFNFIRICTLVLYYRVSVGHPAWEMFAKQADYIIGFCLFTVAAMFFASTIFRAARGIETPLLRTSEVSPSDRIVLVILRCGGLLLLVLGFRLGDLRTARQERVAASPSEVRGERMPSQIGQYRLQEVSYEEDVRRTRIEDGTYVSIETEDRVTLMMWLGHDSHNVHDSWYARGETSVERGIRNFDTASGPVEVDEGIYREPTRDVMLLNALCSPVECWKAYRPTHSISLVFSPPDMSSMRNGPARMIPIAIKVEGDRTDLPEQQTVTKMSQQAKSFLSKLDVADLSVRFQ